MLWSDNGSGTAFTLRVETPWTHISASALTALGQPGREQAVAVAQNADLNRCDAGDQRAAIEAAAVAKTSVQAFTLLRPTPSSSPPPARSGSRLSPLSAKIIIA